MTITEFLSKIDFRPYASVINSWDAFNESGSVLMQLWSEPGQRLHSHPVANAYLRVRCFDAEHFERDGRNKAVGYAGRKQAIELIERGAKGYAAISAPPNGSRGPGVWAKHADLSKVYPVLAIERPTDTADVFAILGRPVATDDMTS